MNSEKQSALFLILVSFSMLAVGILIGFALAKTI